MKISTLLAFVGALPFPTGSARLPDWRKPLTTVFFALHESHRRQAARDIARHQYLLDRYAGPPTRKRSTAETREGGVAAADDPRGGAQVRSASLP